MPCCVYKRRTGLVSIGLTVDRLYSLRCEDTAAGAAYELVSKEEPTACWAMACDHTGCALAGRGSSSCGVAVDRSSDDSGACATACAGVDSATSEARYEFVPMGRISPEMQHAVIAAEDGRFYQHHGLDWHEIKVAAEEDKEGVRTRGASTLTQQLVKNLFFGTGEVRAPQGGGGFARAGGGTGAEQAEDSGVVPECRGVGARGVWGRGQCRYYYRTSARSVGRQQTARLAAILPAPRRRRPEKMNSYSGIILRRMEQMGW